MFGHFLIIMKKKKNIEMGHFKIQDRTVLTVKVIVENALLHFRM